MKPKLTHEFKTMLTVTVTPAPGKAFTGNRQEYWEGATVTTEGDIWEAISAFERRGEARRAEAREAEQKAAMEAREAAKIEREPDIPFPVPTKPPHKYDPFEAKKAYYGPLIATMREEGMTIAQVCQKLHLHVKTVSAIDRANRIMGVA